MKEEENYIETLHNIYDEEFKNKEKSIEDDSRLLRKLFNEYVQYGLKKNKCYDEILDKLVILEEKFINTLNTEQKEMLDELEEYKWKLNSYESEQAFIHGFCMDKELIIEKKKRQLE